MKSTFTQMCMHLFMVMTITIISNVQLHAQSLNLDIGKDTTLPLKQSTPTSLTLLANVEGSAVSFVWSQLSGNTINIPSPTQQSITLTGFEEGFYSFKCDAIGTSSNESDIINIRVVNYQDKNKIPCRTGVPVVWTLSATNTTDLYRPYLRKSGFDVRGGDTIKINANPNNGGVYNRIYLGDFGGADGCPVIVVPNNQVVKIGGANARWFLGTNIGIQDSNFVNNVVFDGTYLRDKTGDQYGFQSTGTGFGMGTRLISDLEIKGCLFKDNSLAIQIKILSDSLYPWTVYDNFTIKNIRIHDNYFTNMVGSEGLYIGSTDPSGTTQAGNHGPVPRLDSVFIYNNLFNGTAWDPIQTSAARYTEIHDNIVMNGSVINQSSQNWGILMGANCTGKIYNNVMYNGKGGTVGTLGYGPTEIYYNFIDSTMGGSGTSDGIYADMKNGRILESSIPGMFPPLQLNIRDNIISRFERNAIFHANNEHTSIPGVIRDNYVIEPTRSISQVIRSNAGDLIQNNTRVTSFPVTIRDIGNPATGPLVQVTQGTETATFSRAKDIIDWLYARLTGAPPPNQPPSAHAGADIHITLPVNSVTLAGTATDSDGSIVSYSWSKIAGPATFNIINASSASTVVNSLIQGTYQFRLLVTDDDGASDVDTVNVTVNSAPLPNQPPVANAGNNISISLPLNSVSLSGSGTDTDGSIVSYSWTKTSGPSSFSIATPNNAQTTVNLLVQGTYQFRLRVTDDDGATDDAVVTVTVNAAAPPPNQPPVAHAGNNISITLPVNTVDLSGSGTDSDGSIVSYLWTRTSGPSSFTIVSANSAQTSVNSLVQGTYQFRLRVTDDDGATGDAVVTVTVNAATPPPVNQPPVVNAGTDRSITLPVNSVNLSGAAADADGSIASYAWTKIAGPAQFNIISASSASTLVNNLVQGTYRFRLVATDDDGASASDTVTITVNAAVPPPVNQPPVVNAGSDITITLPVNSVNLSGSAADSDGSVVSYTWSKIAGPSQFVILNASAAQTSAGSLVQGVYRFRLAATDDDGASASDTVTVTVNAAPPPPNQVPMAHAGSDITITLPVNTVTLQGSGSDADGSIVSYAWTKISGPLFCTIQQPSAAHTEVSFVLPGTYQFRLMVSDDDGAIDYDQVTVTVKDNMPPIVNAGEDRVIEYPQDTIELNGIASDADGIAETRWKMLSGPVQCVINDASSLQTLVNGLSVGTYLFELRITDNPGATAADTMQLTVKPIPVSKASIYPNPATSIINIRIDANTQNNLTQVVIYDVSGKAVYKEEFMRNQLTVIRQVNIEKLVKGTYVVEVEADINTKQTVKFVKQ